MVYGCKERTVPQVLDKEQSLRMINSMLAIKRKHRWLQAVWKLLKSPQFTDIGFR